ncbi:translational activator of cytochrome c oxidase 1, partial [Paragonimus westermani]
QRSASFANKQYLSITHYFGYYCVQPSRSAGHSHWQNVRHIKEAQDKLKSKTSQYYLRALYSAIKAGNGSRDPKLNSHLAAVIAEAKANSVPLSTLEKALKAEDTTDPYLIEVQAQGGLFVLVESCAKSVNSERQRLASLVKKYGCTVPPGSGKIAQEFFDHIGLITFHGNPEKNISTLDDVTNLGIEIGASEVEQISMNENVAFQLHCDPRDLGKLRQSLEQLYDIHPVSVEDSYIPKSHVLVPPAAFANLNEMYGKIRDQHDYVDRIFDNVTVQRD